MTKSKRANKRKQRKTKAKKKQSMAPRPVLTVRNHAAAEAAHEICAITDPFCPGSTQGKWPDNSFTKSLIHNVNGVPVVFNAGANGRDSMLFLPSIGRAYCTNTAMDATTATYADVVSVRDFQPTNAARYRITSWGLKITCPLSKMTATGTLHVRVFSPMAFSALSSVPYTTTMADAMVDIPLQRLIDKDVYVVPMPLGADARLFRKSTDTPDLLSTATNIGWQVVNVAVSGAPANTTGILQVYFYAHVEYVPVDGDTTYQLATPPPKSNPVVRQGNATVLERVGNFVEGAASKVESLFQSKAFQYAAATGVGLLTAGPAGAATGALVVANSRPGGRYAHVPMVD